MCLREVVTMDKNRGYKAYNKFVSELLVDESIREEVITKISSFLKYGNVCFEGNNLFGKCFDFEKREPGWLVPSFCARTACFSCFLGGMVYL